MSQPSTDLTPETAPQSGKATPLSAHLWSSEGLGTMGIVLAGLIISLALRIVLFEPYTIPSRSMEPGLLVGDYVVATKFPWGWSRASLPFSEPEHEGRLFEQQPRRGDVAIFRRPHDPSEVWIKRIIGLPGDRVAVRDGQVIINGQPLPQTREGMASDPDGPLDQARLVRETSPEGQSWLTFDRGPTDADNRPEFTVPEGQYLVLGDHRDNSLDGRFAPDVGVGLLPGSHLVGRAEIVLASWQPGASLLKPWTWFNLRWGRLLKPVN